MRTDKNPIIKAAKEILDSRGSIKNITDQFIDGGNIEKQILAYSLVAIKGGVETNQRVMILKEAFDPCVYRPLAINESHSIDDLIEEFKTQFPETHIYYEHNPSVPYGLFYLILHRQSCIPPPFVDKPR